MPLNGPLPPARVVFYPRTTDRPGAGGFGVVAQLTDLQSAETAQMALLISIIERYVEDWNPDGFEAIIGGVTLGIGVSEQAIGNYRDTDEESLNQMSLSMAVEEVTVGTFHDGEESIGSMGLGIGITETDIAQNYTHEENISSMALSMAITEIDA